MAIPEPGPWLTPPLNITESTVVRSRVSLQPHTGAKGQVTPALQPHAQDGDMQVDTVTAPAPSVEPGPSHRTFLNLHIVTSTWLPTHTLMRTTQLVMLIPWAAL
jgi:hypothetical protein